MMRKFAFVASAFLASASSQAPSALEELLRNIVDETDVEKKGPCMGCGTPLGPVTVSTPLGQVEGDLWDRVKGTKTAAFLGIPYATQKRFEKATPMEKWTGVHDAKQRGPACPQGGTVGSLVLEEMSEDCLSANVFTPAASLNGTGVALPVMFWIHGGGLTIGSAYSQGLGKMFDAFNIENIYDGQRIAAQGNMVVISVNYRLGVLGYTPYGDSPANLGFLDQQEGMRWAKKMAPSFGGDPEKITIFGESAGGESVLFHLASPLAKDLFQNAIVESGGLDGRTRNETQQYGIDFAKKLNCSGDAIVACMKSKTWKEIIDVQGGIDAMGSVGATIDDALPADMKTLFASGNFNKKPTIIGNNKNEASIFGGCKSITADQYKAKVAKDFPDVPTAREVLKLYPVDVYPHPRDAMETLMSDEIFCESNRMIANMTAAAEVPTYRYRLVRSAWFLRMMSLVSGKDADYCVGVPHAAELIDVWGTFDNLFAQAQGDLALSQHVIQAWTNFAHSASPNSGGPMGPLLPSWDKHTTSHDTTYILDAGITALYPKGTDKSHNQESLLADRCPVLLKGRRDVEADAVLASAPTIAV